MRKQTSRLCASPGSVLKSAGAVIADRDYDSVTFVAQIEGSGAVAVIPSRRTNLVQRSYDANPYADQDKVERFIERMKQHRRGAMCYDKSATSYLGFVYVAAILALLNWLSPSPSQAAAVASDVPAAGNRPIFIVRKLTKHCMANAAWVNTAPGKGEPDWMPLARQFRNNRANLILHVPSWQGYTPLQVLSWNKIKYSSNAQPANTRGVYAFVLDASVYAPGHFPPMSTVLYVGETGEAGSETLRTRLRSYRNLRAQKKRAKIYDMLFHWKSYLEFYYATVPSGISTKDCETALLDAIVPPKNKNDFSAIVSNARDYAFQ